MNSGPGALSNLSKLRNVKSRRVSSYDKDGKNHDYIMIPAQESICIADIKGAGKITHIWITTGCDELYFLRKCLLEIFWDNEKHPSVQVPLGDFFGIGHGITRNFNSLPLSMSPQDGKSFNCYFPMPYSENAKFIIKNECDKSPLRLYYYIDYEEHNELEDNHGRFHAQWRRENPCTKAFNIETNELINLDGNNNYTILEAKGRGHYVGCVMNIDNAKGGWYGEGDDMFFIDGEKWPPSLHGTGTEDYFNTAWCPTQAFSTPYFGLPLVSNNNWQGKTSMYRFHIEDPIYFNESLLFSMEHGHANSREDDISTVAYWYQTEPHLVFPNIISAKERLPNVYSFHPFNPEERTTIPNNE